MSVPSAWGVVLDGVFGWCAARVRGHTTRVRRCAVRPHRGGTYLDPDVTLMR
ncbi:MAG: hypothetical protein ACOYBY_11400 [Dermatophilaceae bacterium]